MRMAAGQPKNVTSGCDRNFPTAPTLASTLTPERIVENASATNAPARNTASRRSAMPVISRFSVELLTLSLAFGSELGDLSILVDRDDGVGVDRGAGFEILAEAGLAKRPPVFGCVEHH